MYEMIRKTHIKIIFVLIVPFFSLVTNTYTSTYTDTHKHTQTDLYPCSFQDFTIFVGYHIHLSYPRTTFVSKLYTRTAPYIKKKQNKRTPIKNKRKSEPERFLLPMIPLPLPSFIKGA